MKKLINVKFVDRSGDGRPSMLQFEFQEGHGRNAHTMYCTKEEADLIISNLKVEFILESGI